MSGVQRFDAEMGHSKGHTTISVPFLSCLILPHIAIFYGPSKLLYFLLPLCFARDMFLGITGRSIPHQLPIDLYTLARAFVRACFSSYKLDCRLARHSQFHGRHSRPFNRFSLARVDRQLSFSSPTTVITRYKSQSSSLSAYLERAATYCHSLLCCSVDYAVEGTSISRYLCLSL